MPKITGTNQIIEIVEGTPTTIYHDGYATGYEQMKFEQFLERNGYKPISTDGTLGNYEYTKTVQSETGNVTANTVVKITEELDPQTSEPTGNLKIEPNDNMVKTTMSPMAVVIPALTGCGIGWELQKEYPEFWGDLSDALFGSTTPLTDTNYDTTTFIDVLVQAFEDGGVKAYCDKRKVQEIIEKAYDCGAFNYQGIATPQYTDSGTYVLTGGGFDVDFIISLLGSGMTETTVNDVKWRYNQVYNETQFDSAMWHVYDDSNGYTHVDAYVYKLDNNPYTITKTLGNNVTIDKTPCKGLMDFMNRHNGTLAHGWDKNEKTSLIARDGWVSTVGSTFVPPREGLKHNIDLPTVTDRNNVFSNLGDWIANSINIPTFNPVTGEIENIKYLPIGMDNPINSESVEPTQQGQEKVQDGTVTQPEPFELPDWLSNFFNPSIIIPDMGTPSEIPSGDTPVVVPPSNNNSSKLFTVYNPSGAQLDSLGAYLWSDNIATLIKELFANNRMDAIISLHQVYCTPSTTTAHNIILGNLDSGVSAPVVNNQYVSIDCGSQYVAEMYGDARDYLNVDCQVYLPFIGFRNIDPHDIINCYLNIKYTIDVYTGSCLAQLIITKGAYTQTLYTFEGNCSVQIPLTGADRARIIGAIASTVATGISTGGVGALAMGVGQVASGGAQSSIQRTSGFSGNCGAMAIKKPYIVLTRLKSADAVDYNKIVGNPTNKTVYLTNCKGFTRVREIHLDNLHCTDEEKMLIYTALKQGIVL